jgi:leader peptidase (prepilin peptidase)/N-methyltransferase
VVAALAAVLGLIVGSYLNVVIYRLPRRASTILPRSRCPGCSAAIGALDNVPVLSYLWLRGRCRHCGAAISVRYPAIELLTSLLFAACGLRFGVSISAAAGALFCALAIALAFIDAEHYLLPDRLTYGGIFAGLALSPFVAWTTPLRSALGALAGALILLGLIGLWLLIRRRYAMGFGDPKMLAMIGAFLGLRGMLVTLFFSSLLGSLVGLALMLLRRVHWQSKLPYGVFLAVGGIVALFVGPQLVEWYLGLL